MGSLQIPWILVMLASATYLSTRVHSSLYRDRHLCAGWKVFAAIPMPEALLKGYMLLLLSLSLLLFVGHARSR
eukprot:3866908-Amphidinium_carterae.1